MSANHLAPAPTLWERVTAGELEAPDGWDTYPAPGCHTEVSNRLLTELFSTGGHPTLQYWRKAWWHYVGTHWEEVDEDEVRKPIWQRLNEVTYVKQTPDGEQHKQWLPSRAKVTDLLEPTRLSVLTPASVEAPTWVGGGKQPAPALIAMRNGLFDHRRRELHPHTPQWFNTWALPFEYDPEAVATRWEQFLGEVFEHDKAGALLLQEWAGYLISGRLDLQKMLLIIGVPGGGKSVIASTLEALMGGSANVANPSMADFGGRFTLDQLRGKPLAIFGDASDTGEHNKVVVERLKNITGEGAVSVDIKGRPMWTGKLPTRFTIISNQVPKFLDASSAVQRRAMAVYLTRSFQGAPDKDLPRKLERELPGIFNWALEGLDRLNRNNGRFTTPDTQQEVLEDLEELGSPLRAFFKETYTLTGNDEDSIDDSDVYDDYTRWCTRNGFGRSQLSKTKFRVEVNAMALEGVKRGQVKATGSRVIRGIRLQQGARAPEFLPKTAA
ncbi:DNA primase family protein [Corynebacterium pseudopelargi]|uniref:SF3 helicase domain-containing protein n=1 Tax=Corynebacterium pseudopelargi TaxID=2080757 RepID=A0A3G6ISA5_9CORY|nr:phage/plasmid primase, P4 family [Corynebacterium pseudopelargi]AZA08501.1 hypothetical protein CPPEL_01775 [Corynebacterium pseudopelargi]